MDDLRGTDFRERVFHPQDMEKLRETRRKGCSRATLWDNELRVRRKDGEYRWFLIRYSLPRPESRSKHRS
jgi:PAS fold